MIEWLIKHMIRLEKTFKKPLGSAVVALRQLASTTMDEDTDEKFI